MGSDSEITPVTEDGQLKIKVKISVDAALQEETCPIEVNSDTIKQMETALNKVVQKEANSVITKAQKEWRSDIFGFGEKVRRKYRSYWKEHKNEWNDIFADLPVEVEVKSKIRRSDKTTNSIAFPENRGR